MGYTKPLVKAAGTVIQTGAEKVLRSLPVEQADFIAKTFNFKPGSPQDTFVRMGGIHPTDGPGIINSIQRGEAQDLPQHITNAVGGEPAALNEIGRFSDNGTNQVTEDTIKANQLQQANANKVEPEFQPQQPLLSVSKELQAIPSGTDITKEIDIARKLRSQGVGMKERALAKGQNFSEDALSRLASIGPISSDQVKLWVKGPLEKAKAGIQREVGGTKLTKVGKTLQATEEVPGMTYLELHHEAMKAIWSSYVDQAWNLVDAGKATADDIINLKYLASNEGMGLGDFGVKPYNKLPHQAGHSASKELGIEPTGDVLKQQVETITNFNTIEDLTKDFKKSLEEIAKPMRRQLDLHQRAYLSIPKDEQIKVIRLKNEKDLIKKQLKVNDSPELKQQLEQVRKELKELSDNIKGRLSKQVKKDIAWDIETMERVIDSQQPYGIDKSSDQWRLMNESYQEGADLRATEAIYGDSYGF